MIFKKQDMVKVRKKKLTLIKTAALEKAKQNKKRISERPEKSMSALKAIKDRLRPLLLRSNAPLILNWNLGCSIILKTPGYSRTLSRTSTWKQKPKTWVAKCLVKAGMQNVCLHLWLEVYSLGSGESDMIKAAL